jgi:mannitol/fructose-specific phosphotransferase system IIA component (Ntr-type)
MLFAIILGMMGGAHSGHLPVEMIIVTTVAFAFLILTLGRWLIDRALPLVQAYTTWPGGVLGFAIVGGLFCAAFTEWIGIHAIFGAFLFGVALGDSRHLRERTRQTLEHFISSIFAPLFFASIGLRVNFATNFDLLLVLFVIVIACAGKLIGCGWASRLAGFSWRESIAVGVGMNARGAMEIILALLALEAGLIGERLFVALVVMALFTSGIAGGLMQKLLQQKKAIRFFDFINPATFIPKLKAHSPEEAIRELAQVTAKYAGLDVETVAKAVWDREQLIPTGIGRGVAIPHARLEGLKAPVMGAALCHHGVDFDSPDGDPAQLILFILTPRENNEAQLEILGDIGRTFHEKADVDGLLSANSYVEFIAFLKSKL